jgi:crotonobetainyl-CoA:carnitine CoA-transferase CaiB-like acyl-CoA transferase
MRNGVKLLAGGMAPSGINPCKPGGPNGYVYLCTSHANPEHWRRLLQVIGQKPMLDDPRFATHEAPASAALFKSIRAVLSSASCRSPMVMQARPTAPLAARTTNTFT